MKNKFDRQGFLGKKAQEKIRNIRVGVIGFGGGGSHIGQQLWHIGFENVVIFDPDVVEETNTNRLVGVNCPHDIENKTPKTKIASRLHSQITGNEFLEAYQCRWQEESEQLKTCHLIIGCVDSYCQRDQLERFCRQYMIPYLDIGLDVSIVDDEPPQMAGQVILSMPGYSCMRCLGFIDDEKLNLERSDYGDAGPQAQVVWGNGVLASLAVGIAVDLVCDWTGALKLPVYLAYNGNTGEVKTHVRMDFIKSCECQHHSTCNFGAPKPRDL